MQQQQSFEHRSWGTTIDLGLIRALSSAKAGANHHYLAKLTGNRPSKRWGFGLDFAELREYQPGDEVRHVDWRASARTNKLMTKRYVEDNDSSVLLIVDLTEHMLYGTRKRLCAVTAAYLACHLATAFRTHAYQIGLTWLTQTRLSTHKPAIDSKLTKNLQHMAQSYNAWMHSHAKTYLRSKQSTYSNQPLANHIHMHSNRHYPRIVIISSMAAERQHSSHAIQSQEFFPHAHQRIDRVRIYDNLLDMHPKYFARLNNGQRIVAGSNLQMQAPKMTAYDCQNDASLTKMAKFAARVVHSPQLKRT